MTKLHLTSYVSRLTWVFVFVLFSTGCGLKLPPVAPESVAPEPVKNLRAVSRDGKLLVVFTKPSQNVDGSKLTDLDGIKVMRRVVEDPLGCRTCPEKFPVVHDIDVARPVGVTVEGDNFILTDEKVEAGTKYEYRVVAYNKDGYEGPEAQRVRFLWALPPDEPLNLRGAASDKAADIEWDIAYASSAQDIVGYNIYRRENGRYPVDPVNQSPVTEIKYTDFGLSNQKVYHYVVRAVIEADESLIEGPSSNEIELMPKEVIIEELKGETK